MDELSRLLRAQDGVVSRSQALAAGLTRTQLARCLRRGELVAAVPGVYVDHNGPLTQQQRHQVAVLHAWPSALCLDSALRAAEGPGRRDRDGTVVHVAVDRHRKVSAAPGVEVHRMSELSERVLWNASPPRVRYEESVLDVAAAARDDLAAVACLADAVGSRRTTALRLLAALEARARMPRRAWLVAVLTDVARGTCSVLERGYQSEVVRPHGLPPGVLQSVHHGRRGTVLRDVELAELEMYVELDSWIFHSGPIARDNDLERDLDAAADLEALTVRLGFHQVFARSCSTANKLARIMQRRGWEDEPLDCGQRQCGDLDQPS